MPQASSLPPHVVLRSLLLTTLLLAGLTACDAISKALPRPAARVNVTIVGGDGARKDSALESTVLYGKVTITARSDSAQAASFYLDDEGASGEPLLTLSASPFTLRLATLSLADGPHTLTLSLMEAGESRLVKVPFIIGNTAFAMLTRVNELRSSGYDCGEEGVFAAAPALGLEARLMRAAQRQADDMNDNNFLEHTGADGSTAAIRVSDAGYSWSRVGENIASGQKDVASVVADWAESDHHCVNLMAPQYSDFGVGRAGLYWVQVFARP